MALCRCCIKACMKICAVIRIADGLVINRIIADPSEIPPDECILVDITDMFVDIGYVWDGTNFIDPNQNEGV